jgi:hypothetical protein
MFIGVLTDCCTDVRLVLARPIKIGGVPFWASRVVYNRRGGENGPVTVAAFKAADSALRGSNGGFDSHTPPPSLGIRKHRSIAARQQNH